MLWLLVEAPIECSIIAKRIPSRKDEAPCPIWSNYTTWVRFNHMHPRSSNATGVFQRLRMLGIALAGCRTVILSCPPFYSHVLVVLCHQCRRKIRIGFKLPFQWPCAPTPRFHPLPFSGRQSSLQWSRQRGASAQEAGPDSFSPISAKRCTCPR